MDDDLQHLLNQLGFGESDNTIQKPDVSDEKDSNWVDGIIDKSELMYDTESTTTPDSTIATATTDIIANIGVDSSTALSTLIDTQPFTPMANLQKYLKRLDGVTDEILDACRADRQEAQDVIQMLRVQIEKSIDSNNTPSRMYVDGLVKAVEVKASINMTAVKMMESNAKNAGGYEG